jgi:Na+/H+ antiporter NhaD/arsenite permease-like protein
MRIYSGYPCTGVIAKTGIFEYLAVRLFKMSRGEPFRLLLLLCMLDIVLSAFLDNVTTMLLLAPVCVQLCNAVGKVQRSYLAKLTFLSTVLHYISSTDFCVL